MIIETSVNANVDNAFAKIEALAKKNNYSYDSHLNENAGIIFNIIDPKTNSDTSLYLGETYKISAITNMEDFRALFHLLAKSPVPTNKDENLGHWFFQYLSRPSDNGKKLQEYIYRLDPKNGWGKNDSKEEQDKIRITWEDFRNYSILNAKDIIDFGFGYCLGMITGFAEFFVTDNVEAIAGILLLLNKAAQEISLQIFEELTALIKDTVNKIIVGADQFSREYEIFKRRLLITLFQQGEKASLYDIESTSVILDFCKRLRNIIEQIINSPFEQIDKTLTRIKDAFYFLLDEMDTLTDHPIDKIFNKLNTEWVAFNNRLDKDLYSFNFFLAGANAGLAITKWVLNIALLVKQLVQSLKWSAKNILKISLSKKTALISLLILIPGLETISSFEKIAVYDAESLFIKAMVQPEDMGYMLKGEIPTKEIQSALGRATIVDEGVITRVTKEVEDGTKLPVKVPSGCSAAGGDPGFIWLLLLISGNALRIKKAKGGNRDGQNSLSPKDLKLEELFTSEFIKKMAGRKPGSNTIDSYFDKVKRGAGLSGNLSNMEAFNKWLEMQVTNYINQLPEKDLMGYYKILKGKDSVKRGQVVSRLSNDFNRFFTKKLRDFRDENDLISLIDEPFSSLSGTVFNPEGQLAFKNLKGKIEKIKFDDLMATKRGDILKRANADYLNMIKSMDRNYLQKKMRINTTLMNELKSATENQERIVGLILKKKIKLNEIPSSKDFKDLLAAEDDLAAVMEKIFAKYGSDIGNAFADKNWLDQPVGMTRPDFYLLSYFNIPHFNADAIHLSGEAFIRSNVPTQHVLKTGFQDLIQNIIGNVQSPLGAVSDDVPYNLINPIIEIGKKKKW